MFLKRNSSRRGKKKYSSVLLVQGERVPVARGPGRPPRDAPRTTKVVHRTLANLSNLPDALVALVERYCQAERRGEAVDGLGENPEVVVGPAFGPLAALSSLAKQLGLERALGGSREGRLALFLILARVLHHGSRLSAVRWANTQAVAAALGLKRFDEDDLYAALDWLAKQQTRIECALAPSKPDGAIFLYDVTSSYFEGQRNELAAPGYNRDGKRYKKQLVAGLLTDAEGEPVSIQVYEGNTADPTTVADPIRKLAEQFGAHEIVFVGDRGMLKAKGKALLADRGFRYVTALTDPQIRRLLREGTLQLDLFSEEVCEVATEGTRYILRRNPATTDRHRSRRESQLERVRAKAERRDKYLADHPRADPAVSLAQAERWLRTYKLDSFVSARLDGRKVSFAIDAAKRATVEQFDGCYVVVSDVPADKASAQCLWDRYGYLQQVERDFRTMKTALLEIRPIFLRKAERTRGHALVAMLALKLTRELERRIQPLEITVEDALDRLDGVRLVSFADPKLGLWRLPKRFDVPVVEVLAVLPPLPAPLLSPQSPH
ncbi:MAG: IS1634 family transposase [Terracidiphilus sp.]